MNEITRIHIARTPYEIDIAAKQELENYTNDIKKSLHQDSDIYDDVEIRITELLADQGVVKNSIITLRDVEAIKKQLGSPADFADSESSRDQKDASQESNSKSAAQSDSNTTRSFFRDEDDGIVGGVIAGLAAYTGWDITLLRLCAIAFAFISFGWAVLFYIAVWLVAPAAKTTSEKLQMRGKPVTIDSIKQSAKELGTQAELVGHNIKQRANRLTGRHSNMTIGRLIVEIAAVSLGFIVLLTTIGLAVTSLFFGILALTASIITTNSAVVTIIIGILLIAAIVMSIAGIVVGLALITRKIDKRSSNVIIGCIITGIILFIIAVSIAISWKFAANPDDIHNVLGQISQVFQDKYSSLF